MSQRKTHARTHARTCTRRTARTSRARAVMGRRRAQRSTRSSRSRSMARAHAAPTPAPTPMPTPMPTASPTARPTTSTHERAHACTLAWTYGCMDARARARTIMHACMPPLQAGSVHRVQGTRSHNYKGHKIGHNYIGHWYRVCMGLQHGLADSPARWHTTPWDIT